MQAEGSVKPLTITQAATLAQETLESLSVVMEGEVSQVTDKRGYSAVYFTLKDEHASIPCKMWQNRFRNMGVTLKAGALVQVSGHFTYYGPNGSFSFDATSLRLAGEGHLRMQVAQIAERLRTEGLMDQARKQMPPPYPTRIGLITSPRGAAVRDVLRTLRRRYPLAEVVVCGIPVEGKNAAGYMTQALSVAADAGAEVVLLVRGGGSFEDLMPFNDETLARAVAACPVPVVTGIGHEPDNSICDMVADVRASTPTAAAEAVAPDGKTLDEALLRYGTRLVSFFDHKLEVTHLHLQRAAHHPIFSDSHALLGGRAQQLDALEDRLRRAIPHAAARDRSHIESLGVRLSTSMSEPLQARTSMLDTLEHRLRTSIPSMLQHDDDVVKGYAKRLELQGARVLDRFDNALGARAARLDDLSPLAVIGRGYALARNAQGHIISKVSQADLGDQINVSVSDGTLNCTVNTVTARNNKR